MLTWDTPITTEKDWARQLIPYWGWVIGMAEPMRADALAGPLFDQARDILDAIREPVTVEELNARWREFIARVWTIREEWLTRRRRMLRR